jgi:hypothetical protein
MKLAIYLSAIPKNKNDVKLAVLQRFGAGVQAVGDEVEFVTTNNLVPADLAVMQGFVHNDISSPHLQLRKRILDNNKNTIVIDSNLFQFANPSLSNYYLRYSLNGIFPTTGFYFDNNIDTTRWETISKKLNISLQDYRTNGKYILICLQRVDGWSMCGNNIQIWLDKTVKIIKSCTTKTIVVRKHPGDRNQDKIVMPLGVRVSKNVSLTDDLASAWATVTFNSSPGVASLIQGVPVFVTDPIPERSQVWPVCNTDLTTITNPVLHDREPWIHKLCQSHWNDDEVASGLAWKFMRDRINSLQ